MPGLITPEGLILVTGATGYIGTWIISHLLNRGQTVHAAIRTPSKGHHLLTIFAPFHQSQKLKLIIVGDISEPGTFDHAVGGVSGIIHTASPVGQPLGDPEEMIRPAVEGVRSLLISALKYNKEVLKRIIIIFSCAAIAHTSPNSSPSPNKTETTSPSRFVKSGERRQMVF
jgi:nucleoside-diphosphate-sugar epimerase